MKALSDEEGVRRALAWIVAILRKHGLPFQVVGGLAARAYGATRPIADIDLYVPLDRASAFLVEIAPFNVWGPERYEDAHWSLVFLKIDYEGQRIEIGDSSSSPRIFNVGGGHWLDQVIDYENAQVKRILGVDVPVMPCRELVRYKLCLAREVDLADVDVIICDDATD